jgi:hypothetical protein
LGAELTQIAKSHVEGAVVMTNTDMTPSEGKPSHPYVAAVVIDPANWSLFKWTFKDQPEVKILTVDRQTPVGWTVYAGCASRDVRERIESNW